MPRTSRAEYELNALLREQTGRKLDLSPPETLTTAVHRDLFKSLANQHPAVVERRNWKLVLANYVRLCRRLQEFEEEGVDNVHTFELVQGIKHLEGFLGLPSSR